MRGSGRGSTSPAQKPTSTRQAQSRTPPCTNSRQTGPPRRAGAGGYGYAAEEPPLKQNYDFTILLNFPVFSGFSTREQVKEAQASLDSTRFAATELRRLARLR